MKQNAKKEDTVKGKKLPLGTSKDFFLADLANLRNQNKNFVTVEISQQKIEKDRKIQ
jgi:hypothetical protein